MKYEEFHENMDRLKPLVTGFFDENIKGKFLDSNYVFDVFIDVPPNCRVWLIDFNPWAEKTDPGLFQWSEIVSMGECQDHDDIEWAIVSEGDAIRSDEMSQYRVPSEIVESPYSEEICKFMEDMRKGEVSSDNFK